MTALAVTAPPTEIVVTTGATWAPGLLGDALPDPADVVLVERPTYAVAPLRSGSELQAPATIAGATGRLRAAVAEARPRLAARAS